MRPYAVAEDWYSSSHTAYHESASRTAEAKRVTTKTPERDTKTSTEPSVSLAAAHITISDEAYRLYSQYPKITSTGDERNVKATGDSGDVSRANSYAVSRAQEAYSRAQAHANSFESTRSAEEATHEQETVQDSRESSEGEKKGNWVEDVAKIAGDVSAGAATVSVLTAWDPPLAAGADVVSAFSGLIALGADVDLFLHGEKSATTLGLDVVALTPAAGLAKEGATVIEQLRSGDLMHPIQSGAKEFASDEKMWTVVGKTYQELGGGIVSVASSVYEGHDRHHDK
ncbi:hypothetical protein [Alicyclobacillus sendaiensis]|uniref:Uncharacterized protein n=1 Tax=Alicyclobacillus sendaiensis PA2 TaxID=3029425 RepID=A0ABT6Y112_ALISE|nr:hypothetical protein [Alicyclobacillus sendaiensis]MDI9261039.1 hypothetical protein [Alicyclobacillus sendaiensis PA2]